MHEARRAADSARDEEPWLGRFIHAHLLARAAGVDRHVAKDLVSGEPRLVLCGGRAIGARLDRAAHALSLLDHPHVPCVVERGCDDGVEWLSLACDIAGDLERVFRNQAAAGQKLHVAASWALAECWLDVLAHAHERVDPETGRPLCVSGLTWSNVMVTPRGVPMFLGFGDDLCSEPGQLAPHVVRAPEVAAGALPWPGGDLWAVLTLFHSLLPLRELPPTVARVMQGAPSREDASVHARLRRLHASILCDPEERTVDARWVETEYRALWSQLGVLADRAALHAFVREGLARLPGHAARLHALPDVEVERDASAFRVRGGARVDLGSRHVARRLLAALVAADGHGLATHELVEAGWPGERMRPEAGVHRVHVALHQLRRLGLSGLLVHGEQGYRLACRVLVTGVHS